MSNDPAKLPSADKSGVMPGSKSQRFNEGEISRLLRFKRYELPPPGFHENLLREFQRRQRIESMRPNWWGRLREGVEELAERVRVPGYAYATAGLFAVAASAWILSSEEIGTVGSYAQQAGVAAVATPVQGLRMDLSPVLPSALPNPVNIPEQRLVGTLPPLYLLQSRPSAETEPFSF